MFIELHLKVVVDVLFDVYFIRMIFSLFE